MAIFEAETALWDFEAAKALHEDAVLLLTCNPSVTSYLQICEKMSAVHGEEMLFVENSSNPILLRDFIIFYMDLYIKIRGPPKIHERDSRKQLCKQIPQRNFGVTKSNLQNEVTPSQIIYKVYWYVLNVF